MARIYFEYAKNTFWEYPDYFMFALFVATSFMFVSLRDVLINIPKDSFPHAFNFFVYAVENTNRIIQVLVAGFLIRVVVVCSRLAYKSIKDMNIDWTATKIKY